MFINRDSEIQFLKKALKMGKKILLKGKRGIGKSALMKKILEELEAEGIRTLSLDCQRVSMPSRLLLKLSEKTGREVTISENPYEVLETLFRISMEEDISVIFFDEFTYLVRDFSRRNPYRGSESVIAHLRSLISEFEGGVVFASSTLLSLSKLVRGYERRMARMFDVVFKLENLTLSDTLKIIKGYGVPDNDAVILVEASDGVPFYAESLALSYLRVKNPEETVMEELTRGALSEYFRAIYTDLPIAARRILEILATGPKTYQTLVREIADDTLPFALKYLLELDFIGKIKKQKTAIYYLKDKLLGIWVRIYTEEIRDSAFVAKLLPLAFESLIRELFLSIKREIEITDYQGKKLVFGPVERVEHLRLGDIEINLLAHDEKGRILVGEITMGSPQKKIQQLNKVIKALKDKLGISPTYTVLISYFQGIKSDHIVLTRKELNSIAKKIGFRPI